MSNPNKTRSLMLSLCLTGAAATATLLAAEPAQAQELTRSGWFLDEEDNAAAWMTDGNPGNLRVNAYVPDTNYVHPTGVIEKEPNILIVLHGCTKTNLMAAEPDNAAVEMAIHGGFQSMVDAASWLTAPGYNLLVPGQKAAGSFGIGGNNPAGCWNWFEDGDNQRGGGGEADTIWKMVEAFRKKAPWTNDGQVYVAGFSAGGSMAAVMAAAYPDKIAGAAIASAPGFWCVNSDVNFSNPLAISSPIECMKTGLAGKNGDDEVADTLTPADFDAYSAHACNGNADCLAVAAANRPKIILIQGIPGTEEVYGTADGIEEADGTANTAGGATDDVVAFPRQHELRDFFGHVMEIPLDNGVRPSSNAYKHPLTNMWRFPYGPDGGLVYGGRLLMTQLQLIGHNFSVSKGGCGAPSEKWHTSDAAGICAAGEIRSFFGL